MTLLSSQQEIDEYLACGQELIGVFSKVQEALYAGEFTSALDIDAFIEKEILALGARPVFKGYSGYPNASCISVNSGVVHCIPSDEPFAPSDIISVDMGMEKNGWVTDAAFTFALSPIPESTRIFLDKSYHLMREGVALLHPGITVKEFSTGVEKAADVIGITIVPKFTGHALGKSLHEDPLLPNVATPDKTVLPLGSIVAVEPICSLGSPETIDLDDGWSTQTEDGSLATHYEESVIIGEEGGLIATPMEVIWTRHLEYLKNIA
jgi:methionyl aminopeptidase